MSSEFNFEPNPKNRDSEQSRAKFIFRDISKAPTEGKIAQTIGGGDNAKNSFIWVTIRWSFVIGAITSLAIYLRPVYCGAELQGNLIEDIKSIWSLFMPVITLALGYSFGKGR
ncbi:MAG TPA: hypothetical protein DEF75_02900 [Comamonas kerstersii]|nr:hypothetical protein [Comamonas kerstersii]